MPQREHGGLQRFRRVDCSAARRVPWPSLRLQLRRSACRSSLPKPRMVPVPWWRSHVQTVHPTAAVTPAAEGRPPARPAAALNSYRLPCLQCRPTSPAADSDPWINTTESPSTTAPHPNPAKPHNPTSRQFKTRTAPTTVRPMVNNSPSTTTPRPTTNNSTTTGRS